MQITKGKLAKPLKAVIYGPEGIGKSTLASRFPDPVFVDTEGSTNFMDVARLPAPSSWTQLMAEVQYIIEHPEACKTLVIDTADWAEKLCTTQVLAERKLKSVEDAGYGKGYVYVKEEFARLLNQLTDVTDKGINVVVTAHAQMRKFEQPDELGAYDRWEMKLSKQCCPLLKEWADMILFCNYKTMVVNVDNQGAQKGKNKAQGGRRVMYTTHHACWDAKNRFGLPDEIDMDYEGIRAVVEGHTVIAQQTGSKTAPRAAKTQQAAKPATGTRPDNADPGVQMTLHGMESTDPVVNARKMTPEQAKAELARSSPSASGVTAPPPDEDPAVPPKSEGTEKPSEAPGAGAFASAVSPYFSDPARLPKALTDLMEQDGICEWDIQTAIAAKGYYPDGTLIQDMDPEFIKGWIIAYWPQVKELITQIKENQEIPFN